MRPATLAEIGEFGLIDRIAAIVGKTSAVVGIGDDAAVLDQPGTNYLLATVDMLVEGVHFVAGVTGHNLGRRSLAVSLSDIAAMGGTPAFALISIAVPGGTIPEFVEEVYTGLVEEGSRFGVAVVGGNVTRTAGPMALDVVILGHVPKDEVVLRDGARPGDLLIVTGVLGGESAMHLAATREVPPALRVLTVPVPRIELGRALASAGVLHAMADLSDGLGSDIHHIARRSDVGVVLYEAMIPIAGEAREAARLAGVSPLDLALFGGEDYELVAAIPSEKLHEATKAAGAATLYAVGVVVDAAEGVTIERPDGRRDPLEARGWHHFPAP